MGAAQHTKGNCKPVSGSTLTDKKMKTNKSGQLSQIVALVILDGKKTDQKGECGNWFPADANGRKKKNAANRNTAKKKQKADYRVHAGSICFAAADRQRREKKAR